MARPTVFPLWVLLLLTVLTCGLQVHAQYYNDPEYYNAYPGAYGADLEEGNDYGNDEFQFSSSLNAWSAYPREDARLQQEPEYAAPFGLWSDSSDGARAHQDEGFDVTLADLDDEDDDDEDAKPRRPSKPPSKKKPPTKRKPTKTKPPSKRPSSKPPKESPTRPGRSAGCRQSGNPVDDCWRCDPNWTSRRQSLAACAVGFGRSAGGGKNGRVYVVTSNRDDNPADPAPGTLRYAVPRPEPLWITFASSMVIKLKNELVITSYKTIDGRGVTVRVAGGGGLRMERVSNIIVHNINIYDIVATGPGKVMRSTKDVRKRNRCDSYAISIFAAKNIWIDHCYLSNAADGLIDVINGFTGVTIANTYFAKHNKVMLFGASMEDKMDRGMYVTVAYNRFGPGLTQRMPRVRCGNCHVVNNDYSSGWGIYAIGCSEAPTILSQGNVFNAYKSNKQVTDRIDNGGPTFGVRRTGSGGRRGIHFSLGPTSPACP